MISKKSFLLFLFLFLIKWLSAQNINGFVIPVTKDKLSSITFHSKVTDWHWAEKNAPYKISSYGSNGIMIETSQEVQGPYNLVVGEGGRKHRFVLVYKDDIDLSEQDKDYSDLKQLEKSTTEFNSTQQANQTNQSSQNTAANTSNNTAVQPAGTQNNNAGKQAADNKSSNPNIPPANNNNANTDNSGFYALMDAGDSAKNNQKFTDARAKYEQALLLKPGNAYAQGALNEVNKLIQNQAASKYQDIITKANNAFYLNSFDEALKYYNDALAMKPDDLYSANQIKLIQRKQEDAKAEAANKEKDSLFNFYLIAGDKSLSAKSYDVSLIYYNEALKMKPDDVVARSKLNSLRQQMITDSISAVNKRNDDAYTSFLNNGNKAMQEKRYNDAKLAYNEALQFKPKDPVATSKLNSINQQMLADSLQSVADQNQNLYAGYIKTADQAFKDNLFDNARNDYNNALKIKPNDTYAKSQVKKIDDAAAKQASQEQQYLEDQKSKELQDQYRSLISSADNYYKSGMYDEAKDMYTRALAINSKDQYSKNQILQINSLITQRNDKQKQDSLNNLKYTSAILKADQYFNDKDFVNAKTSYSTALKYKADDEYVKERLSEIDAAIQETAVRNQATKDSIAKDNEDTKKYNALIVKARAAYTKNDYLMARGFYASANALKPNEAEPVTKISAIDDTLNVVAAQKQMRSMSDSLVIIGEIALADSDYAVSVERFNDALKLNPADPDYIKKQINYAKDQLKRQEALNNQTKKTEEQQKKLGDAINLYRQGKAALKFPNPNYDSALIYFQQFLSVTDTLGFTSDEYDLPSFIKYSKSKVSDIQSYLERQKNLPKDTAIHKLPDVASLPGTTIIVYYNPKDPKLEPIYKKYPDIDFTKAPDEQRFDSISDYSIENKLISKNVMTAASMNISENTNDGIKLTCQNIIFIGQKVYIKLMLQNSAAQEFLTGNMQLTQKLQNGSTVKLLPNYIAGYPIILTNQQKIIVYVTRAKEISDNDSLDFEVTDRLNQIKISVTIPGSIYNQEKKKSSK